MAYIESMESIEKEYKRMKNAFSPKRLFQNFYEKIEQQKRVEK